MIMYCQSVTTHAVFVTGKFYVCVVQSHKFQKQAQQQFTSHFINVQ